MYSNLSKKHSIRVARSVPLMKWRPSCSAPAAANSSDETHAEALRLHTNHEESESGRPSDPIRSAPRRRRDRAVSSRYAREMTSRCDTRIASNELDNYSLIGGRSIVASSRVRPSNDRPVCVCVRVASAVANGLENDAGT